MKTLTTLIMMAFAACIFAQDTIESSKTKRKNAYGFRLLPSKKANIYGVAIGPLGGDVLCNDTTIKRSHGINIQLIGQGLWTLFAREYFNFERVLASDSAMLVNYPRHGHRIAIHNGVLVSTFGTWSHTINGVSISGLSGVGHKVNGISFNLWQSKYGFVNGISFATFNQSHFHRGIQIGIINRTVKLRGFQFGLWNVNEKRKLPLVNWSFRD